MKLKVGVYGLGYVGLPLSIAALRTEYSVVGIDTDLEKISKLNSGVSIIEDITDLELTEAFNSGYYKVTSQGIKEEYFDIILICVPTPLNHLQIPDLSYLNSAIATASEHVKPGSLVVIESTVATGTTREVVLPLIEKISGLARDKFHLAFSPERVDPKNSLWNIRNTPKLISGFTKEALQEAVNFYSKFVDTIIECVSLEVAETAKLLENSFRYVNISFINELSIFCQKLGVDVNEVVKAAATKPYGFMPFHPSIGVGGHCIPVDSLYLSNKARELGAPTRFIDLADQINQEMPGYFVGRAEEKLGGLKDKRVLVLGVAYKPNVADVRETPVTALISGLKSKGAQVSWHDDLVKEWNDEKSVELKIGFDLAIIATPHTYMDLTKLGDTPIIDTRGSI